jgi:hypothetical protein
MLTSTQARRVSPKIQIMLEPARMTRENPILQICLDSATILVLNKGAKRLSGQHSRMPPIVQLIPHTSLQIVLAD